MNWVVVSNWSVNLEARIW